jgi:hypothetical protein
MPISLLFLFGKPFEDVCQYFSFFLTPQVYYFSLYCKLFIHNEGKVMRDYLGAGLFVEAAVVGIVCIIFLMLFIVAGIRQILKERD